MITTPSIATLRFLRAATRGPPTPCLAFIHRPTSRIVATQKPIVIHQQASFSSFPAAQQPLPSSHSRGQPHTIETLPKTGQEIGQFTHYDFFPSTLSSGPPPEGPFSIDLRTLRSEFLKLQALAHPDRFPHNPNAQSFAQTISARINEAYKTLQDPLLRAQYLLQLRQEGGGEEAAGATEEAFKSMDEAASLGEGKGDQELLMEVLELREAIEEAESQEEIDGLRKENEGRIRESVVVLERAFASDDLLSAGQEAVKLRYWVNVEDTLKAWEQGKPVVLQH